jgi:(p)ppGpp synthase/HD superfamily hydrolase
MQTQLTKRFSEAVNYACVAHNGQVRKGTGIPYVSHLLGVAAIALEYGATEEEAIAALLHDVVEDQGGKPRLDDVRTRFGSAVANIVEGCTDADVIPKPPWRQRKENYLSHIAAASASVRLVSTADKLHNARSILADYRRHGDALWTRFNASKEETLWYYRALVTAFRTAGPNELVDELDRVVTEIEQSVHTTGVNP